jgi:hypothetical protein
MILPGALPHNPARLAAVPGFVPFFPLPIAAGYDDGVQFLMFDNDILPDCTVAGIANFLDLVWHHAGRKDVWTDAAVERMFDLVPPCDRTQGRALLDVLEWWAANGLPDDPLEKPISWVSLTQDQLATGIQRYGAVYTRVMLPMGQDDWDWSDDAVRAGTQGTGSHCVLVVGCDAQSVRLVSYGERITVSRAWWAAYGQDEAYGILHPLWRVG